MPYDKRSELPETVRDTLPGHAQDIYQAAFNNAWDEYADPAKRRSEQSREEVSHKVAWAAVKHSYEKNEAGNWVKK